MMMMIRPGALFCGLFLYLGACQEKQPAADAPAPQAAAPAAAPTAAAPQVAAPAGDAAAEAKTVFAQRCTLCHGVSGKGDGPASATLSPRPRNYSDGAWQASVADDALRDVIVKGGAAMGKSMMMPPNPDLKDKPEVVNELVKIIRGFKK